MELTFLGITGVASITAICYLVGQAVKITPLDSKFIPVIAAFAGALLGVAGMHLMLDFPATGYLTAAAVGIASGLAATGADQVLKQLGGGGSDGR